MKDFLLFRIWDCGFRKENTSLFFRNPTSEIRNKRFLFSEKYAPRAIDFSK